MKTPSLLSGSHKRTYKTIFQHPISHNLDWRAVARDIFLDGNTFRDSRSVNKEPFVADISAGIGLIAGRWQATYTQVRRTREFKTQQGNYDQFGSVTLSCAF